MEFNELILKVTSCCNLNCRYCYVFNQGDNSYMSEPPVMSPRLIHSILFRINEHCRKHNIDEFLIIFHGGEPLMASKSFYTHFIKEADKIVKDTKLLYGLQTNATLLSQEWIDLFQKLDISIGVSIDGPRDASINRVYRNSGRPAYDSIIAGINLLKANNLPVNILSVINTSSDPHEVYAHLQDIGVEFADFLFPDVTYDHGGSPKTGEWLCQLFDLWYDDESDRKPIIRYLYLEPSKQLQTMKNTWRQTFVYQLLLDFNTSNLLFGGSQKSAYLCNAFLPRRILRAFILPSRGQS